MKLIILNSKTIISKLLITANTDKDGLLLFDPKKDYSIRSLVQYQLLKDEYRTNEMGKYRNPKIFGFKKVRIKNKNFSIGNSPTYNNYHRSKAIFFNVLMNNNIQCEYCSKKLKLKEISIDHFIPSSRGGSDNFRNYRVSCSSCNSLKGSLHPKKDFKLFFIFLEYVNNKKLLKTRNKFSKYVINHKKINVKDYPKILNFFSLSLISRINLLYELSISKDVSLLSVPEGAKIRREVEDKKAAIKLNRIKFITEEETRRIDVISNHFPNCVVDY